MAKRITKLSKLSKSEVKQLMKKLADNEIKPMHLKGADGVVKNGVLFNNGDEELLVILDNNVASKQELELLEKELGKLSNESFDDDTDINKDDLDD